MRTKVAFPEIAELSIARPENLIVIENHDASVVIRAQRDNFSPREKACFIRYLAAEGYIREIYQWFADPDSECSLHATWIVDGGRFAAKRSSNKALQQILRLIGCAALVWLVLMIFAFLHAPR